MKCDAPERLAGKNSKSNKIVLHFVMFVALARHSSGWCESVCQGESKPQFTGKKVFLLLSVSGDWRRWKQREREWIKRKKRRLHEDEVVAVRPSTFTQTQKHRRFFFTKFFWRNGLWNEITIVWRLRGIWKPSARPFLKQKRNGKCKCVECEISDKSETTGNEINENKN